MAWRSGPLRLATSATDRCPDAAASPDALCPLGAPDTAGPAPPPCAHAPSSSPAASTAPSAPTHPAPCPCRMWPSLRTPSPRPLPREGEGATGGADIGVPGSPFPLWGMGVFLPSRPDQIARQPPAQHLGHALGDADAAHL